MGHFNAHAALAVDAGGRLWLAWDEGGPEWGKDTGYFWHPTLTLDGHIAVKRFRERGTGLYESRWIQVRVREKDGWHHVPLIPERMPAELQEFVELPALVADSAGRMWLLFRHRTCRRPREDGWAASGRWDMWALAWLGHEWSAPVPLPDSGGRNDMRAAVGTDAQGTAWVAYATDHRPYFPQSMPERNLSITLCSLVAAPEPGGWQSGAPVTPAPALPQRKVHATESEDVARVRTHSVRHHGRTYRIYRGDLHRHTDISSDGVGDGSLMDLHRYALDVAALDFILVADHNMGNDREYSWWRTQKANDLYTVPGTFISMYGYERSVRYPNGHRNVIWTRRGHRTLALPNQAIPAQMARDTSRLYEYLRASDGICTAHTTASDQGTDWRQWDGRLEPIVELFQGYHTSYEMAGAPLAIDERALLVHGPYKPDGFVQEALQKGYRLGFQASSDHIATHTSYACVLAEEFTRTGLVEAMRKRHTYAATDNILVDFRARELALMGDECAMSEPSFDIVVVGTAPLAEVTILRNGQVVHRATPADKNARSVHLRWTDPQPERRKTSYYYVRTVQRDGHMAWASPIWVRVD